MAGMNVRDRYQIDPFADDEEGGGLPGVLQGGLLGGLLLALQAQQRPIFGGSDDQAPSGPTNPDIRQLKRVYVTKPSRGTDDPSDQPNDQSNASSAPFVDSSSPNSPLGMRQGDQATSGGSLFDRLQRFRDYPNPYGFISGLKEALNAIPHIAAPRSVAPYSPAPAAPKSSGGLLGPRSGKSGVPWIPDAPGIQPEIDETQAGRKRGSEASKPNYIRILEAKAARLAAKKPYGSGGGLGGGGGPRKGVTGDPDDPCNDLHIKEKNRCYERYHNEEYADVTHFDGCLKRATHRWDLCNRTGRPPIEPAEWGPKDEEIYNRDFRIKKPRSD